MGDRVGGAEHGLEPTMIVLRFKKSFPLRVTEWFCAFVMAHWGLLILLNPAAMTASPTWVHMVDLAEPALWGGMAALVGLIRIAALAINGAWRQSPHTRAACAFVSVFLWLQITWALMQNDSSTTGQAIYPWLLLLDMWNVARASADARLSDDRARGAL